MQQKTRRPVQFEITEQTRLALEAWIGVHLEILFIVLALVMRNELADRTTTFGRWLPLVMAAFDPERPFMEGSSRP